MAKKTFQTIAQEALVLSGKPLTDSEIWELAKNRGLLVDFESKGKTPVASLAARIYTDIKNNGKSSAFYIASKKPTKFGLTTSDAVSITTPVFSSEVKVNSPIATKQDGSAKLLADEAAKERDLHALLTAYVKYSSHFKASIRTIFHESSKKNAKGYNEWLHPDLAGVYFPFQDFKSETLKLQKNLSVSSVKIFSFEMKIKLTLANLRQYYFQAVSNSSWANEGYLVVLQLDDSDNLRDEISRLNNAFGIGVIQLSTSDARESRILFPARVHPELDWNTLNRLVKENESMQEFLENISNSMQINKVVGNYDRVLPTSELADFIKKKGINK